MKGRPLYDLPEVLQPVIEAIGYSATLSLVHVFGGARLYVPKANNMQEDHPVARLLGMPLATKLAVAVGGEAMVVPLCFRMLDQARSEQVAEAWEAGDSIAEIAHKFACHERSVRLMLARHKSR